MALPGPQRGDTRTTRRRRAVATSARVVSPRQWDPRMAANRLTGSAPTDTTSVARPPGQRAAVGD
jgi:hypothetical protein